MGIDITRPLCGIQRDINHPSSGFGRQPNVPPLERNVSFRADREAVYD